MRSQLELTIIALIFFFIFTNNTVLETLNKLFIGFLGDEKDDGIRHTLLYATLFGLFYFITLIIINKDNNQMKTAQYPPYNSYNNNQDDDCD
ncbi:hypothetical protein CPAV1605_371 [seawater metagenome]|uniref:Uncharacterized protein n=1 Tax=seawater metagenome TaxID=1561972 RepID=A0A5E8CHV6_9ZZZZ